MLKREGMQIPWTYETLLELDLLLESALEHGDEQDVRALIGYLSGLFSDVSDDIWSPDS